MLQIIEENKRPTTAQIFGKAFSSLGQAAGGELAKYAQQQQIQNAYRQLQLDPEAMYLPEDAQKKYFEQKFPKPLSELDLERKKLAEAQKNLANARTAELEKPKSSKKTQASQPIDPEQLEIIKRVRATPEYQEADSFKKYQLLTDAGVSKENSSAEANLAHNVEELQEKRVDNAYKMHEDYINDITKKYQVYATETEPKLLQMQQLGPDEEVIGPKTMALFEGLGLPLGLLENPKSELYSKLSQDLLKGLPESYGNRILKVEVDNFLKTIPTLLNSREGRRMIASNMLKLGEMKKVFYHEMRNMQKQYLDSNKPLPKDFEQRVWDQVQPRVEKLNQEFVKMSSITHVPKNSVPMFAPNGNIYFIPQKDAQRYIEEKGGKRIW